MIIICCLYTVGTTVLENLCSNFNFQEYNCLGSLKFKKISCLLTYLSSFTVWRTLYCIVLESVFRIKSNSSKKRVFIELERNWKERKIIEKKEIGTRSLTRNRQTETFRSFSATAGNGNQFPNRFPSGELPTTSNNSWLFSTRCLDDPAKPRHKRRSRAPTSWPQT